MPTARAASSACRRTSRSRATRCSTRMPRASCIWSPIPATRARWCSATASDVWLNPPPIPLTMPEMDWRLRAALSAPAASGYGDAKIPAYEMIRFSVDDPARLLRRLHVLLDHRARGPHHPEPLRGLGPARDRAGARHRARASPASSRTSAARRRTCTASPARARDRERLPPAVLRVSRHLPEPQHRPRAAHPALPQGARAARHQESADRLGRALRPRGRVARVRQGAGAAPRRRLPQDRARAYRGPLARR